MFLTGAIILAAIVACYIGAAAWLATTRRITFHQALFYLPLKLIWRVDDERMSLARDAGPPVIYVVTHRSRLDPALMLSLLPSNTLHILDGVSARSRRLEPFRSLARTIVFNAEHLFISRRLVRHLRGKGRLAVYLPEATEPTPKQLSLIRAVARIAGRADAKVVPIFVDGYRQGEPARKLASAAGLPSLPKLTLRVLPAATIAALVEQSKPAAPSNVLFERMSAVRLAA